MGLSERRPKDAEIEAALLAGDHDKALRLLMQVHGDDVLRFAFAMTRDTHLAEEIQAQVFVEACRDLDKLKDPSAAFNWLLRITRNRSIDFAKAQSRQRGRLAGEQPDEVIDPRVEHGPDRLNESLDRKKRAQVLGECVAKLPPKYRSAVLLRFYEERSYDEAASITEEQAGTVQRRVSRALPLLKKCMRAKGASR